MSLLDFVEITLKFATVALLTYGMMQFSFPSKKNVEPKEKDE